MERELQGIELDQLVTLHLSSGALITGRMNDWDWGEGLIKLYERLDDFAPIRHKVVVASTVVAYEITKELT
jgi:hypothetical protein